MTTTPHQRQPAGIPVGGQFAHSSHAEPGIRIDDHTPLVRLEPGATEDYPHLVESNVWDSLSIHRSDEDGGYWIRVGRSVDPAEIVSAEDLGSTDEEHAAWVDTHSALIEDYLTDRYDVDTSEDDDRLNLEFATAHPDEPLTEAQAVDAAWSQTTVTLFRNESDPGTNGSESLSRLLREHAAASTVVASAAARRADAQRLSQDPWAIDTSVDLRMGQREISDSTAMAIARAFADEDRDRYPALTRLAHRGHAVTESLQTELHAAYLDAPNPLVQNRIHMMGTWILNGGDNA